MSLKRSSSSTLLGSLLQYEPNCSARVLIIVTGGTFIMAPTPSGLVVQPGYLSKRMTNDQDFHHPSLPSYDIIEWENPIDSSCIRQSHWIKLAKQILQYNQDYNGFIILHGTDTMSYTASALSFMLENINKPVVLTGAQIPIGEVFNDAKNNLLAALCVAGKCEMCEVCLMFANKLLRGNRSTKIDPWHQNAYHSPNFPTLGIFGIDLEIEEELFRPAPVKNFVVHLQLFENIIVLWIIPGFNPQILLDLIELEDEMAIVLGFYGVSNDEQSIALYEILLRAVENGKVVVFMSQCCKGFVDCSLLSDVDEVVAKDVNLLLIDKQLSAVKDCENEEIEVNDENDNGGSMNGVEEEKKDICLSKTKIANELFSKLNAMNAADMTVEAVVTKLAFLMGQGLRGELLKSAFETNLRGEMTPVESVSKNVLYLPKNK